MKSKKYLSPYLAGVGLGLVLLASFFISGHGLGASGTITRAITAAEKVVAPQRVDDNPYLSQYGGGNTNPLNNWYIFEILGLMVGGVISGVLSNRMKKETNHGPRISKKQRLIFALTGGTLFGFGARLARGCTSGVALSGGAILSVGAWITMMAIFIGAYALAFFVRKLWI